MFRYILSWFFENSKEELSIEDAAKILTEDAGSNDSKRNSLGHPKIHEDEYNLCTKIGTITHRKENNFILDNLYEFEPDNQDFDIGDSVSYQKLITEGKIVIYNVLPVNKEWDTVYQREAIVSTRTMVCQVEKREKRVLHLTPGQIKVDLDKVSSEFIPVIGDWLELNVKYEVDEYSLDLSGKVIEVNQISPLRPHIQQGKISFWDSLERKGCINKNIFFDCDSLSCGYKPVIGDKVVTQVIESEQGRCNWRAFKVLPAYVSHKMKSYSKSNEVRLKEEHPGLEISDASLNFKSLGENKDLSITLTNKSEDVFEFLNAELSENATQIALLENNPKHEKLLAGESLKLNLTCTSKNMGCSNEFLVLNFQGFSVGKYININVNPHTSGSYYQRNENTNFKNVYQNNGQLIRGQRNTSTRFRIARIPDYHIPKNLLDLVVKYEGNTNNINLLEELRTVKRALFSNLTLANYEDKFHTLLHMDEITNMIKIRQYDLEKTCFIPNGDYLMVEIENLAERRPSIVLGDRILAWDPKSTSQEQYEGNVFKVGAKHVYLKFSGYFHETYKGEDYSIKVVAGRSAYKRQHHAIFLVARNLGRDWLFPSKVTEKTPQVDFVHDPYPKTIEMNNTPNKDNNKITRLMKKIQEAEMRKEKELNNSQTNTEEAVERNENETLNGHERNIAETPRKLKWFNHRLNCKQKDAVINIIRGVSRPHPYVIFGPPGTGKTVTLIESILQIHTLIPQSRILITAPSNSAADLVALRLIGHGVLKPGDLVRLVSVNYAVGDNIPPELVPYCATGSMAREGTSDHNILAQNGMTHDCSREVLGRHKITVSTCSSAGTLHLMGFQRGHFTHIFVDEAGQAAEPEVMIPISFLDKYNGQVALAGDPMQLGPVILCRIAAECGLNESFLERLTNRFPYIRDIEGFPDTEGFDPRLCTKLLYNYRSLGTILGLFSSLFYHNDLIATISDTSSPEAKLLLTLTSILPKTKDGGVPSIVFHGVEGENYQTDDSPSWYNPHEAAQVFYYINEFYRLGLTDKNVGIITPYIKQVREIRQLFRQAEFSLPKIGTVEDFQGQEFDVVVMSTVRSSQDFVHSDIEHSLGFVSSPRRLNVAISRPKVLLVIIGNPALLCNDMYWRSVLTYCVEKGAYTGCNFCCT